MSNVELLLAAMQDPINLLRMFYIHRPRPYQEAAIRSIYNSILHQTGDQYTLLFPRQSGKNEVSCMIEFALLMRFSFGDFQIVKAAPSFRPQAVNSLARLKTRFEQAKRLKRFLRHPYPDTLSFRHASAHFVSASRDASQVGLTASLLLECDEAQDVDLDVWDTRFLPMTASTNAVVVYYGTPWTSETLLYREHFSPENHRILVDWETVAESIPAYGDFVRKQIARLTTGSPIIQTQYLNQFLDYNVSPLLTKTAQSRMKGRHDPQREVKPGQRTIMCLDVASTQLIEAAAAPDPRVDSSAAVVFGVKEDEDGTRRYDIIARHGWQLPTQPILVAAVKDLYQRFAPSHILVDVTGLGAGLFLVLEALGLPVLPITITSTVKSRMGFGLIGLAEAGRLRDYRHTPGDPHQAAFWAQVAAAELELLDSRRCKWGVKNQRIHDDQLVAAAMIIEAETLPLRDASSFVIEAHDPLESDF